MRKHIFLVSLFILFASVLAFGQTADVVGQLSDETGAVLPGVTITLRNVDTGMVRTTVTSERGLYSIRAVPPGNYDITAELEGFETLTQTGLKLTIGTTATINISLKIAAVREMITVTGETPLIEGTQSDISTEIPEQMIANLPLLGRNFVNLALLAPGTGVQTTFDPTKERDGDISGVSFGASSGRENNVMIDGGDNNDDVVGSFLQFFPQDSIQEFEVITSRFKAEYGHTVGGVINVISKSGTNELHGGFYTLHRPDSFTSITAIAEEAATEAGEEAVKEQRIQHIYGGLVGGPIVRDKAFFFGNIDYTKQPKTGTTIIPGYPALNEIWGGEFDNSFSQNLVVGKFTAQPTEKHFLTARYAYQKDTKENSQVGGINTTERGGPEVNKYHSMLAKDTIIFNPNTLGEVLYQYTTFLNAIDYDESIIVAINTPELATGRNGNLPQRTEQWKHHFRYDQSYHLTGLGGEHDWKVGFEYQNVLISGFLGSARDKGPRYSLNWYDTDDYLAGMYPDYASITYGWGLSPAPGDGDLYTLYSLYFQDDFRLTDRLTLNLGLRWDLEQGILGERRVFASDSVLGKPDSDKNNFAPRLGFAYDIYGDSSFVIRGGWGLFYQQVVNNLLLWLDPLDTEPGLPSGNIFNPPWGRDEILAGQVDWTQYITVPVGIPTPQDIYYIYCIAPDVQVPMSQMASIGFSKEMPYDIALDVDYVYQRIDNPMTFFRHLTLPLPWTGQTWEEMGLYRLCRVADNLGRNRYQALEVAARKRFGHNMMMQASYTLSSNKGFTDRELSAINYDLTYPDWENANYGPITGSRTHVFNIGAMFNLPYDFNLGLNFGYGSPFAFTIFSYEGGDMDGDGFTSDTFKDHKAGQGRGGDFKNVDVRLTKAFSFADRYRLKLFFEVFNLFDGDNRSPRGWMTRVESLLYNTGTRVLGVAREAQVSVRIEF
ncbi:MAG: TonB-dependent receptor [Candidatus Aminicenantes bacterium]|nr:TonB-dependent receptor [Candidatus Aminicenantes bacterium]